MKTALMILFALAFGCRADLTIIQRTDDGTDAGYLVLRIKDDKARVDVAPHLSMITDLKTGDTISLNHKAKTFVRVSGAEAAKMRLLAAGLVPGAEPPKLTPTQRKERVMDRDCQVFTWRVGEVGVTDWIDPTFPDWKAVLAELQRFQSAGLANAAQALMPPLEQFSGMVIKREMIHRGTRSTSIVISVAKDPLDQKVFALPQDYKEQITPKLPETGEAE